ncbi:MAG TPA: PTS system mannose/fructose/sorbose family transporter subunit IID [Smithellaceae bacterium]|nr:PTS system mannose/fructose/sorbose family transporter subunit IID [Smithellaceae bacterium]HOM70433.1 PTS system mannose/fructose/sorbose family transporter subunit IID [Smithellaceae bacterium]HOS09881.1 PTS system mannose/fructose/sorbose family transporter subunit IID [Smithellaceae bacterium]HOZ62092.1 PTS system mannose/fructose/sorbose family transporter subunit IID [Smithellaceae bacterium]HPD50870.1 PTS system mannose/fructose/sorbose family transporter subunit IID [Smithellaceae ba
MKKATLVKILLRSFFIHVALNFRRMQNLGFAFSIIPLLREWKPEPKESAAILNRHLQMYNSHPYFSAPVIGSVVRLEEEIRDKGDASDVLAVKNGLMGPYAAIGDTFFWGALRPFAGIVGVVLALQGFVTAPLVFLLIYTPPHLFIRVKGFIEGYRRGKQGMEFIRALHLTRVTSIVRWLSVIIMAVFTVWLSYAEYSPFINTLGIFMALAALAAVLLFYFLIKKGMSQIQIIYGVVALFFVIISLRDLIN